MSASAIYKQKHEPLGVPDTVTVVRNSGFNAPTSSFRKEENSKILAGTLVPRLTW